MFSALSGTSFYYHSSDASKRQVFGNDIVMKFIIIEKVNAVNHLAYAFENFPSVYGEKSVDNYPVLC